MYAGLRLAIPLLRATLHWLLWFMIMPLAALYAVVSNSVGISLGASAGAGALLVLAAAFGLNLRRCRGKGLARALPGFEKSWALAIGIILVGLVMILGGIDSWRPDSLLGLLSAAAIGLGIGLVFPPAWLSWAWLLPLFWFNVSDLDLVTIWTSNWSAPAATLWLLFGYVVYSQTSLWDRAWVNDPSKRLAGKGPADGHQPFRLGFLLNLRPALMSVVLGSTLCVLLAVVLAEGGLSRQLSPGGQKTLIGYLVIFTSISLLSTLIMLLGHGLKRLRLLAVLPGWARERLFVHVELSCWRVGLWLFLALNVTLLAAGVWAGNPMWGLWMQGLVSYWILVLLSIYSGLWIASLPGGTTRMVILMFTLLPLIMIVSAVNIDGETWREGHSPWNGPLALATSAALAWWLRRRALFAWAAISFNRED